MKSKANPTPIKKKSAKRKTPPKQQQSDLFTLNKQEKTLLEQHKTLKLQVELVPNSCWFSNVRSNVTKSEWDKIRKGIYVKANYLCEVCGGKGTAHPVECHEVWVYDEDTLRQRLAYFQAICPLCHEVKHIGLAGIRGNGERASARFQHINELSDRAAEEILSAVWKQWRIRSRENWKLDVGLLKAYDIDINTLEDKSKSKRRA